EPLLAVAAETAPEDLAEVEFLVDLNPADRHEAEPGIGHVVDQERGDPLLDLLLDPGDAAFVHCGLKISIRWSASVASRQSWRLLRIRSRRLFSCGMSLPAATMPRVATVHSS